MALSERVLVVAASDGLWRSGDAGRTWRRTASFATAAVYESLARADGGVVADVSVVSHDPIGRTNGELYFSDDGTAWRRVMPVVNGFGDNHSLAGLIVSFDGTGASAHGLAFGAEPNPAIISGPMLHSSDGGRHWQAVAGLDSRNGGVQAVAFVPGTRTAYAAVDQQPSHHCSATLVRSDDGGASWRPSLQGCRAEGISALSFIDGRHGFAAGASLLGSSDGGRSWAPRQTTRAPLGQYAPYAQLAFSDPHDGTVLAGTVLAGACGVTRDPEDEPCRGEVWFTADGGRSWTDAHLAAHEVSSSGRTVIAAGGPDTPPGLSVSTDGGRRWSRIAAPGDVHVQQLTGPPDHLVALTNGLSAISADGGRTWRRAGPELLTVPYEVRAQAGSVVLRAVYPALQRSADGGRTWANVRVPGPNNGIPPGAIAFNRSDPTKAVILEVDKSEHTQVLTSSDSGQTWNRASTVSRTVDGMVSYDGSTIVFTAGRVEVSHDDGHHFTGHPVGRYGYRLYGAGVAGSSVWVTGFTSDDKVLVDRSNDGGTTWIQQLLTGIVVDPYTRQLPDVLPLSDTEALLALNTGSLLRTVDAGKTWRQEWPTLPVS